MTDSKSATINNVKEFWNSQPLFTGEGSFAPGSAEWFVEHETIYNTDVFPSGRPNSIMTEGLEPWMNICNVGCGPGYWVRFFLREGFNNVSACDLTPNAVSLTQNSLGLFSLQTKGRIVEGNAEALPFEDGSFDHVNCQGVIHHTPDAEQCIREFYRVLKPGGTVCFSVYYKNIILPCCT